MESSEVTSALEYTAMLQAQKIKAAIDRIDAGSYRECVDCGIQINPERLRARPHATRYVDCAA
jgi:RNA polymerase-binding transcription factor DksA